MTVTRMIHVLKLPLVFPSGISAGESSDGSTRRLALDGRGRAVLRGSAIGGALRHAFAARHAQGRSQSPDVAAWFGESPKGTESATASSLRVADAVLDSNATLVRQHNAIDRHRGTVESTGLFAVEAIPPGARATVRLVLDRPGLPAADGGAFIQHLINLINNGFWLGGARNRGVGLAQFDAAPMRWSYDLHAAEAMQAWLDDDYRFRSTGEWPLDTGESVSAEPTDDVFTLRCTLAVPRGQDLLVGEGRGIDDDAEPQQVLACDGHPYWRLPGSALRGPLRQWFARLAALDGEPLADSAEAYKNDLKISGGTPLPHDQRVGWCRAAQEAARRAGFVLDDPVCSLFGSLHAKGRLVIADAYARIEDASKQTQRRFHVAVDRFSGGVNEGALFTDRVLTAGLSFDVLIHIERPRDGEVRRLAKALAALDAGLIRIGASKSAGRLAVIKAEARGAHADQFQFQHLIQEPIHG